MYDGIVIHFGELWLKGKNRGSFIDRLYSNIAYALGEQKSSGLKRLRDRFILEAESEEEINDACGTLGKVSGISWFAPFIKSESGVEAIIEKSAELFSDKENVRIEPHRSFKGTDFNSDDIVSAFIRSADKLRFVPNKDGDHTLFIEVLKDFSILHKEKIKGLNGLPVGVSGKAIVLLSGGIDSPVAAYYAMKRGLAPVFLHIYAYGSMDDVERSKMPALLDKLSAYSGKTSVYYIPAHIFQMAAMKESQKYEVVLFKKFIYAVAERIAELEGAKVIVTGESLGQVSSQTVDNLIASGDGVKKLFFRPLIGMDKEEIIDVARAIGTYAISIMQYKDACSLRAKNPATSTSADKLHRIYGHAGIDEALEQSMKRAVVRTLS